MLKSFDLGFHAFGAYVQVDLIVIACLPRQDFSLGSAVGTTYNPYFHVNIPCKVSIVFHLGAEETTFVILTLGLATFLHFVL